MRRSFGIAVKILIVLLAFGCIPANAQTTGSISGTVKDPDGAVIPDIAVIAHTANWRAAECGHQRARVLCVPDRACGDLRTRYLPPGFQALPAHRTGDRHQYGAAESTLRWRLASSPNRSRFRERHTGRDREHADGRCDHRPGDDGRRAQRPQLSPTCSRFSRASCRCPRKRGIRSSWPASPWRSRLRAL